MPDQIPEETKNARLDQLMMLQQAISMDFNESRVGTTCEVLVEGFDEETGRFYGRSILEAPESDGCIWLEGGDYVPGEYVSVAITGAEAYDLTGRRA